MRQFAISSFYHHHTTTMTLIVIISVMLLLLPFHYIPQLAWSQSQETAQDNAYTRAQTEHIQVGDINIAYKRFGQGKPILFISGTSQTKDAWESTLLSELAAANHTVIVFDNRGMGETTVGTQQPFSIEQFANDTAGLLDALQIEKADVFGLSLGSLVAQELTLNYPQKVDRLILHATGCGNEGIPPSEQTVQMLMTITSPEVLRNMTAEQQAIIFAQLMFPPEWLEEHPEILNTIIEAAPFKSAPPEIIQQQGLAAATWKGSCDRLANITQPTLLIVGDQDLLAPPANSIMMAQRIPNSWLVIIQGTGHGMMEQVPNEFSAIIQTFLETSK